SRVEGSPLSLLRARNTCGYPVDNSGWRRIPLHTTDAPSCALRATPDPLARRLRLVVRRALRRQVAVLVRPAVLLRRLVVHRGGQGGLPFAEAELAEVVIPRQDPGAHPPPVRPIASLGGCLSVLPRHPPGMLVLAATG